MRFKVLFYSFLFAIAGFLLPLAMLAVAAPYVINAEPFRDNLIKDLRNWTGSHVELNGPVEIESFFSLSLNAKNVEFYAFKGLPQLKTLKAEEIIARIAWMDLFYGRLEFDKIKINRAQIKVRAFDREDGLTAAKTLLAMSRDAQFDAFVLQDSMVTVDEGPHSGHARSYPLNNLLISLDPSSQDIELSASFLEKQDRYSVRARIRAGALREPGATLPLEFSMENPQASASFEGTAKIGDNWRALGNLSIALQEPAHIGKWLNQPYIDGLHLPFSVSGKADITKSRAVFDEARLSLGEQKATGEFDILLSGANPRLLGSIAFGTFDSSALGWTEAPGKLAPIADYGVLRELLSDIDLDLRLSAESMKFAGIETEEAAFTVLGKDGRFSTEIAHMTVFDGGVFGHAELDLSGNEPRVKARLTLENLDVSRLQTIANVTPWLSGNVAGNIEASTSGLTVADWFANTAFSGKAIIPDEGQIRLDLERLTSMQSGEEQQGWEGLDATWSEFNALRFAFAYERGVLALSNIALEKPNGVVKADGSVNTREHMLDLHVDFVPAIASGSTPITQAGSKTAVSIQGPWMAPLLRSVSKPNRAANDMRDMEGTLSRANSRL